MTPRIKRVSAPEPPFWFASAISPYALRRASPITIDYVDLVALHVDRAETTAATLDELPVDDPVLIVATDFPEVIHRRGEDILARLADRAVTHLISTRSATPDSMPSNAQLVVSAWPPEIEKLETLHLPQRWGMAIPVLHPITTKLDVLASLADFAKDRGASFLTSIAVTIEPAAKHDLAGSDEDVYELLFHGDVDALHIATERHIAALAHERAMLDYVPTPNAEEKSNWNAAVLLTLTAARMLAMDRDVELAGSLARSARAVATLEKPIERIAEAANLSIIESLDEVSVDLLSDWLESGRAAFAERVNAEWRLRRDAGLSSE
jgi:hypothetical protein